MIIEVLGYSERGIFNSFVFCFREHPEKIDAFLKTLEIKDETIYEQEVKYTFLVEQSFSDFGSSDLVIIAENQQKKSKIVIFVEGKVKTTQGNFSLEQHFSKLKNCCEKFNGISSNIFVQLYYKHLLFIILKNNKTDTSTLKISNAFLKNKNSARKIGNNGIVLNAIDRIRNATNVYYVAILPNNKQTDFKQMISELNETVFKGEQIPIKNVHSIYWGNIENIFPYGIVKDNFTYNKGQIY